MWPPIREEIWGGAQEVFSFLGLEVSILVNSPAYLSICFSLLHCNTSRSRPPVRLPTVIFRADCGSVKGAGVPAEDGIEYSYATNLIISNVKILSHGVTTTAALTAFIQMVMSLGAWPLGNRRTTRVNWGGGCSPESSKAIIFRAESEIQDFIIIWVG